MLTAQYNIQVQFFLTMLDTILNKTEYSARQERQSDQGYYNIVSNYKKIINQEILLQVLSDLLSKEQEISENKSLTDNFIVMQKLD